MAFRNELISENEKANYDWNRFKWHPRSYVHRPWKWTIDRDRNAFLVMLTGRGREGEHPERYALWWQGDVIVFSADQDSKGNFATGVEMTWRIFDLEMKTSLLDQNDAIQKLIREALAEFGFVYDRTKVKSVKVVFVPPMSRGINDDSRPGAAADALYNQRRPARSERPRLLDNYEFPSERRVFLPIVGGIAMIAVFVLWIYLYVTGGVHFGDLMSGRYQRGRGPLLVMFIWLLFISMLIGGMYCLWLAFRNAMAKRATDD